jgi:hypothetical protein
VTAIIETARLSKSYEKHHGMIEVDLEVHDGEAFGFLSPTGPAERLPSARSSTNSTRRAGGQGSSASTPPLIRSPSTTGIGYRRVEFVLYDGLGLANAGPRSQRPLPVWK